MATVGSRAILRDARPLLWHAPPLLVSMLIVNGAIDWRQAAEISMRFMLTAMPVFWLHRVTTPSERMGAFQRILPLRIRFS